MTDEAAIGALLALLGLEGAPSRRMDHGMSGDLVARIDAQPALYAKISGGKFPIEFAHELAALRWLDGRAGAPRLVWTGEIERRPTMVTEAVAGTPLHALTPQTAEAGAVAALGALAALHALPIADCPFDQRLATRLPVGARRVAAGEIDPAEFDPERTGRDPASVLVELEATQPADEDLVVAHGDASWPNFILRPDGGAGLIDLGRFGVADRYLDLAIFVRSALRNFPELPIRPLVLAHYPVDALSEEKLAYYRLLDELF